MIFDRLGPNLEKLRILKQQKKAPSFEGHPQFMTNRVNFNPFFDP